MKQKSSTDISFTATTPSQAPENCDAKVDARTVDTKLSPAQRQQKDKLNEIDGFPTPPILNKGINTGISDNCPKTH